MQWTDVFRIHSFSCDGGILTRSLDILQKTWVGWAAFHANGRSWRFNWSKKLGLTDWDDLPDTFASLHWISPRIHSINTWIVYVEQGKSRRTKSCPVSKERQKSNAESFHDAILAAIRRGRPIRTREGLKIHDPLLWKCQITEDRLDWCLFRDKSSGKRFHQAFSPGRTPPSPRGLFFFSDYDRGRVLVSLPISVWPSVGSEPT
jgi:hypothetical protein